MFVMGLNAENDEILQLMEQDLYSREALAHLLNIIEHKLKHVRERQIFESAYLRFRSVYEKNADVDFDELVRIKMHTIDVAIKKIRKNCSGDVITRRGVVAHFRHTLDVFLSAYECETSKKYSNEIKELANKARLREKKLLNKLYKKGEIDNATRIRLALDIALEEVAQLEEEYEEGEHSE